MGKLDDKVAIITGGSGGIGKAAGKLFVKEELKYFLDKRFIVLQI